MLVITETELIPSGEGFLHIPYTMFFLYLPPYPLPPLVIGQKRENYPQTPFFQGGRGVRGVIMKIKKRKYFGGIEEDY